MTADTSSPSFKRWLCLGCGWLYDEALGDQRHGLAPGTRWADVPADWHCPDCGTPKGGFLMVEIDYAADAPVHVTAHPGTGPRI